MMHNTDTEEKNKSQLSFKQIPTQHNRKRNLDNKIRAEQLHECEYLNQSNNKSYLFFRVCTMNYSIDNIKSKKNLKPNFILQILPPAYVAVHYFFAMITYISMKKTLNMRSGISRLDVPYCTI